MFSFLNPNNTKRSSVTYKPENTAYLSKKPAAAPAIAEGNEFISQLNSLKADIQRKIDLYAADEKAEGGLFQREINQYTTRLKGLILDIERTISQKLPADATLIQTLQNDVAEADKTLLLAAQNAFYNMLAEIIMNFAQWKQEVNQLFVGGVGFAITEGSAKKTIRIPSAIASLADQYLKMENANASSPAFRTEQLIAIAKKAVEKSKSSDVSESMQFCRFVASLDKGLLPAGILVKMKEVKNNHPIWLGESAPQSTAASRPGK